MLARASAGSPPCATTAASEEGKDGPLLDAAGEAEGGQSFQAPMRLLYDLDTSFTRKEGTPFHYQPFELPARQEGTPFQYQPFELPARIEGTPFQYQPFELPARMEGTPFQYQPFELPPRMEGTPFTHSDGYWY